MTYNQFLNYVKEQSVYELEHPEQYQATINHVIKNNSVELDGICLHKQGETLSPTVYLNHFYDEYLEGRPLKSILSEIIATLNEDVPRLEIPATLFDDYETIRPNIILRIVNYDKNSQQLENCPYLPFCDLAVTFRWLVHHDSYGIASALITNRELEHWNISIEELYTIAIKNTMRLFPAKIRPMQDILKEYMENEKEYLQLQHLNDSDLIIYVLTNQNHINGSTCMIYDHVLAKFAKRMGCDLYILPSSIHEVLLLPSNYGLDEESLLTLVHDANQSVVESTDVLSDSIYRYDAKRNRVIMIQK
jgi:hypothetical protein